MEEWNIGHQMFVLLNKKIKQCNLVLGFALKRGFFIISKKMIMSDRPV